MGDYEQVDLDYPENVAMLCKTGIPIADIPFLYKLQIPVLSNVFGYNRLILFGENKALQTELRIGFQGAIPIHRFMFNSNPRDVAEDFCTLFGHELEFRTAYTGIGTDKEEYYRAWLNPSQDSHSEVFHYFLSERFRDMEERSKLQKNGPEGS